MLVSRLLLDQRTVFFCQEMQIEKIFFDFGVIIFLETPYDIQPGVVINIAKFDVCMSSGFGRQAHLGRKKLRFTVLIFLEAAPGVMPVKQD